MNVGHDALDDVAGHLEIMARQQGRGLALSQTCQQRPVVTSCGGGLYTHWYRAGTGFVHPLVYCTDLSWITYMSGHQLCELQAGHRDLLTCSAGRTSGRWAAGLGGATVMAQLIEAERSPARAPAQRARPGFTEHHRFRLRSRLACAVPGLC